MMETSIKVENVAYVLRKTLKENSMCCCAGDFVCQNCKLLSYLEEHREYNCPNCSMTGRFDHE